MQIYSARGKRHTYAFGIDDDAPLRKMYKNELARMYFPTAVSNSASRHALLYLTERARQDKGHLSNDDASLCREDGMIYLKDVLLDLGYSDCALMITPDQAAAIFHFLGPLPDLEDCIADGQESE